MSYLLHWITSVFDWLATYYEPMLLGSRLVFHMIISFVIGFYTGKAEKQRYGIAFIAACMAGACFAESARIVINWDRFVLSPIEPFLTIIMACVCALVVLARGNVAAIIPYWLFMRKTR